MPTTTEQVLEAIKGNDVAELRSLIHSRPDAVNDSLSNGLSPLMTAIYYRHKGIADLLLFSGARLDIFAMAALGMVDRIHALAHNKPTIVNTYSPDGWTPLGLAAYFGQKRAVWTLLHYEADVSAISHNQMRNTPLHAAIAGASNKHGNEIFIVYLLIARGAPMNATDFNGYTPLHIVAAGTSEALILGLLGAGADINARDNKGLTPLGIAISRDQGGAADLLRQMGASEAPPDHA